MKKPEPTNWLRFIGLRFYYALLGAASALCYVFLHPITINATVEAKCAHMFKMPDGFYEQH